MSVTRRQFAFSLAAAASAQAQFSPIRRYLDASTEVEILALSDPDNASYLPHYGNRAVSARNTFVIYSTETPQGLQALRLDLKGGATRFLTSASALNPKSVALSPDDRTLYFADGDRLLAVSTSGGRLREVFKATSPEAFTHGLSLAENGTSIALIDNHRLTLVPTAAGTRVAPRVVAELEAGAQHSFLSTGGQIFFRGPGSSLHLVAAQSGAKPTRLPIEGDLGPAIWNPDGRSILFLRVNQGRGKPNSLHEYSLDTKTVSLVGPTSQFVHFGRNADSSVFVGASGSKAQPYILLMLRVTRRELALCEHKSSDPASVAPIFSPNSQRIYFQSDRLGKPVIFSVAVEKLVEDTSIEESPSRKS